MTRSYRKQLIGRELLLVMELADRYGTDATLGEVAAEMETEINN